MSDLPIPPSDPTPTTPTDTPPPERALVLVDQDADGIRISAAIDGVTYRTPVPLLSPDVARDYLRLLLPWIVTP